MEQKHKQMNRKTVRLQEYNYNSVGVYFLTLCTENRRCILSRVVGTGELDGAKIELLPMGAIADKYLRQLSDFYENLSVESYVIMPNHMHILLQVKEGPSGTPVPTLQGSTVSQFVSTFKRFCNREYGTNIWQRGSYDHIIRDQADFDQHMKYIYENPFGWLKDEYYTEE